MHANDLVVHLSALRFGLSFSNLANSASIYSCSVSDKDSVLVI